MDKTSDHNQNYIPKGVSVVIPNYNGKKLFERTIHPLYQSLKRLPCAYEVIVSDDCSTDDSLSYLESMFPEIKIVRHETNTGFSKTINRGIDAARLELVLLLNSDIILTENYFDDLLKYFADNDTFGVMGRIIGWDDEIIQDSARFPMFEGFKIKTSENYLLDQQVEQPPLYTMYLSGANALVDRAKLKKLGGFDELFSPFYIEDVDLSLRAWRMGWKCYYENKAVCRHRTSSSIKAKSTKKFINRIYNRNKLYLHRIHLSDFRFLGYLSLILVEGVFKALIFNPTLLQSVYDYFQRRSTCEDSRHRFERLATNDGRYADRGLVTVFRDIKSPLSGQAIIRFKSGKFSNGQRSSL